MIYLRQSLPSSPVSDGSFPGVMAARPPVRPPAPRRRHLAPGTSPPADKWDGQYLSPPAKGIIQRYILTPFNRFSISSRWCGFSFFLSSSSSWFFNDAVRDANDATLTHTHTRARARANNDLRLNTNGFIRKRTGGGETEGVDGRGERGLSQSLARLF